MSLIDLLWTHTWWSFARDGDLPYSMPYHLFNLLEGCAWILFSVMVLVRRARHQKSGLELWYALAFATFGLTDFREAYYQQSWLIWLKVVNLGLLVWLRNRVMNRLYPTSKLY
jgi:hypothetical protein